MSRRPEPRARRVAAAALCAVTAGCVNYTYVKVHYEEPVELAKLQTLRPDTDDLGACLQRLGAPRYVWRNGRDGMALAWVWREGSEHRFGISFSPVHEAPGASFNGDFGGDDFPGCVLWFDDGLVLREWRTGRLGDLRLLVRSRRVEEAGN